MLGGGERDFCGIIGGMVRRAGWWGRGVKRVVGG